MAEMKFLRIGYMDRRCHMIGPYHHQESDSRNKTRLAKVVVVANSKQKVFSWTQLVVKYTSKNFGYDYTLYWIVC